MPFEEIPMHRSISRTVGVAAAGALLALGGIPAHAHVSVSPTPAEPGGNVMLDFRVPNERDDADTVQLEVELPVDQSLRKVSAQAKPGWSAEFTTATLATSSTPSRAPTSATPAATPLVSAGGHARTDPEEREVVTRITWRADDTAAKIRPGMFDIFTVRVGPLP